MQELGFNMKVMVWFVGYNTSPSRPSWCTQVWETGCWWREKDGLLIIPMQPAGADRLAKVRRAQRGCAAGIAFIC